MQETIVKMLITFGIGMSPILELRGAIPFAIGVLHLPTWQAFLAAVLGNMLAVVIILKYLNPVSNFLMKNSPFINKYLTALFHKTRHKHSKRFNEIGAIFLISFVAVPLPITGAWTGALISFLFGVSPKKAFILISIGILCAGVLVSLGFESISALVRIFS